MPLPTGSHGLAENVMILILILILGRTGCVVGTRLQGLHAWLLQGMMNTTWLLTAVSLTSLGTWCLVFVLLWTVQQETCRFSCVEISGS